LLKAFHSLKPGFRSVWARETLSCALGGRGAGAQTCPHWAAPQLGRSFEDFSKNQVTGKFNIKCSTLEVEKMELSMEFQLLSNG
jgi:hypothetical protein